VTIVGLAVYWFKVPFQGNFWSFLWLSFMYVFSGLGLGLLISILARNQKQAQQMLITMMLLGVVLGGFIFPRYAMPPVLRWAGNLFPLTYFIPIARGIVTKGVSIDFLWGQVVALLVHTLIIVLAAIRAFKPRLE
ncbi:MAG: ABC transporter permease, partial [Anaerolineae bacterium]|nr:ABC transporter permease [Anaerolineae bacterium]